MDFIKKLSKRKIIALAVAVGFIVGHLSFVAYRMITYKSANIHHHANFALYIDGKRDEFKSFTFYEEVQACVDHGSSNPKTRVHMHNQDPSLVHVHDGGVTWGHFFANLGYGLTDKAVQTDVDVFTEGESGELSFILNGKEVDAIANRIIASEDVLLVSFGKEETTVLKDRFKDIPKDAHEFNGKFDPGGCSGNEELTISKRFRAALGIDERH